MSERSLEHLAARQHGVISIEQAHDAGLTNSAIHARLRAGRWNLLRPRVYRLAGAPLTWRSKLMAECLALGNEALASHRSAGRLWQLRGLDDDAVEVTISRHRLGSTHTARVHRCKLLLPEDRREVDAIPVTGPELTLLQLGSVLPPWRIDGLVDDAIRRRLTDLPKIRWRLRVLGRRGRNGSGVLRSVLDARDPDSAEAQSTLEREFVALVRSSHLPRPLLQHLVVSADGRFLARLDVAWPEAKVGVELDGAEFHAPLARWAHDLERQVEIQSMGWTVHRFTWWHVRDRKRWILSKLAETIRASGIGLSRTPDAQNV